MGRANCSQPHKQSRNGSRKSIRAGALKHHQACLGFVKQVRERVALRLGVFSHLVGPILQRERKSSLLIHVTACNECTARDERSVKGCLLLRQRGATARWTDGVQPHVLACGCVSTELLEMASTLTPFSWYSLASSVSAGLRCTTKGQWLQMNMTRVAGAPAA